MRRSVVKHEVRIRISQVKLSNCFGFHPTLMISKDPNSYGRKFYIHGGPKTGLFFFKFFTPVYVDT